MPSAIGPHDQYVFAVAVLIGTYGAASFLLWLAQRSVFADRIKTFRGIAQNFLTVINVLFALNLAFLANDTWIAHDRATTAVFQEAGNLRTIIDLASQLPEEERSRLRAAVEAYASLTANVEWPMLARRQSSQEVGDALDSLLSYLSSRPVAAALNPSVHSRMLEQAIQARSSRDLRIALSQTHVNPLKWLGMAFLGFLTMVSITMVHVDQPRAEILAVLLFATASAPTAAIILIHGNPFQQPMALSPAPIASLVGTR
ncbi:MAG: DUF4239 domain-containing protein [Rhodospirillales bacterium]|nr:DUF4239 domain-containing protein [Rhodospirillales bacterium]